MKIKDILKAIENMTTDINLTVHVVVIEVSDEPCSAEVRAYSSLESAKNALKKLLEDTIDCYKLSEEKIALARASFEENFQKAFVITLDEDECVQYYAHIEPLKIQN